MTHSVIDSDGRQAELCEAVPLEGMRAVIAHRMAQSLQDMAQLTLHREVGVTTLLEFQESLPGDSKPGLNDLVLGAVARTLTRHPAINATLEEQVIYRWKSVHLGMAVALDPGLVVPVIRNAERLSLQALREEAAGLAAAARSGRLTMPDLQGGTFTVSNLGAFGVDGFTPIINPPQVAILGIGRVRRESMMLSLTIDHRALDGVPAARFLQDLATVIENPGGLR